VSQLCVSLQKEQEEDEQREGKNKEWKEILAFELLYWSVNTGPVRLFSIDNPANWIAPEKGLVGNYAVRACVRACVSLCVWTKFPFETNYEIQLVEGPTFLYSSVLLALRGVKQVYISGHSERSLCIYIKRSPSYWHSLSVNSLTKCLSRNLTSECSVRWQITVLLDVTSCTEHKYKSVAINFMVEERGQVTHVKWSRQGLWFRCSSHRPLFPARLTSSLKLDATVSSEITVNIYLTSRQIPKDNNLAGTSISHC
jgi:hypothetical protein